MKIFDKRPLSLILCIMLGSFVFFYGSSRTAKLVTYVAALLLLSGFIIYRSISGKRGWLRILCCAFLIVSLFSSDAFYRSFNKYNEYDGVCEFVGTVIEKNTESYYSKYTLDVSTVNGKRHLIMPRVTFIGSGEDYSGVNVGTEIKITARAKSYDDAQENTSYYTSKGISSRLEDVEEITILSQCNVTPAIFFSDIRTFISRHAIMISDAETGGLLSALLLGDREDLSGKIALDFRRIGISHILALSGMHLSILCIGLSKLLSLVGCGKKSKYLFVILFTAVYMFLTGMPTSIQRAGMMLIISSLLFLFSSTHDSFTSLSVSVFLIVLFSPTSAFDTSLWLSAFATLGVITYSEYESLKSPSKNMALRIVAKLSAMLLISVFAIGATYIITLNSFHSISTLSPISTLIFSFLVQIFLYLGILTLIFGGFLPIGKMLTMLKDVIAALASVFSEINGAYFSIDFLATRLLLYLVFFGFAAFLILSIRRKRIYVAALCLSFVFSLAIGCALQQNSLKNDEIIFSSTSYGDNIVIKSEQTVFAVDASSYGNGSAYGTSATLSKSKITELDGYCVTHYSNMLPKAIDDLLSSIRTDIIYLPFYQNNDERTIAIEIIEIAKIYDATVDFYLAGGNIFVGDVAIKPQLISVMGSDVNKCILNIATANSNISYMSSGIFEGTTKAAAIKETKNCDVLLLGHYGKGYDENYFIDFEEELDTIAINGNGIFFTQKALEFYETEGCKIYKKSSQLTFPIR